MKAEIHGATDDFVARVATVGSTLPSDAMWVGNADSVLSHGRARIKLPQGYKEELSGDVLLIRPSTGVVHRLIRASSSNNFFLVTEQCDQLCVMCSQPPKKTHLDRFSHYQAAALLAPSNARITITGGEPTLHKQAVFKLISETAAQRPDISFHVLSNAQHFVENDIAFLRSEAGRKIVWGVPLYAHFPSLHDEIVGKVGAFANLLDGLAILGRSGAKVELRTVVMKSNAETLPDIARFITTNVPFAAPWAIMQLENIGFARNRWSELFFDNSARFEPIAEAIDVARMSGVDALLYNFPLCTVPTAYRRFAPSTISDWKRRYVEACEGCLVRNYCGGFFEWYPEHRGFGRIGLQ
jgi:His-Xaa-Ser system radical SAM maturase HxsC